MNNCLKCKNIIESEAIYGLHTKCFETAFGLESNIEFTDLDPKKPISGRNLTSSPEMKKHKGTFFHGNYRKYSARLGQVEYILKVKEPQYPELPLVEYLCNQIAELLRIDIPPYHLINFNGEIAFVTRNFMQDHIGTLHHIYHFLPAGDENYNCEKIITAILAQTGKLADVVKFIEICLFDSLIGNNDRHGRNLGIIETASTKKLAPMYDNPSCLGTEEEYFLLADTSPSGCIWTEKNKEPKPLDYINEFTRLDYETIVTQFKQRLTSQSTNIINTIHQAELSQIRKNALVKLIQKRIGDFENAKS